MGEEILTFGNIKIEKHKLYHYKRPIFKDDVDIKVGFPTSKMIVLFASMKAL